MAGRIHESGLKQDRCEGQHGRNPEERHLCINRWLVEGVVAGYLAVRVFCGRVFPDASPRLTSLPFLQQVVWVPASW